MGGGSYLATSRYPSGPCVLYIATWLRWQPRQSKPARGASSMMKNVHRRAKACCSLCVHWELQPTPDRRREGVHKANRKAREPSRELIMQEGGRKCALACPPDNANGPAPPAQSSRIGVLGVLGVLNVPGMQGILGENA